MKTVIDTNIVIDAIKPNPDFETDAKLVSRDEKFISAETEVAVITPQQLFAKIKPR